MFIRLKTSTGEVNLIASNIALFVPAPRSAEGSDVVLVTGHELRVNESCRTIRNALKKLGVETIETSASAN